MARGDHYAVYGCSNDSNKLFCVMLEFFDSTHQKARKMLSNGRDCLTVAIIITLSTKVCSNDFKAGYRSKECPNPTLYLKGYSTDEYVKRRPSPKKREVLKETTTKFLKLHSLANLCQKMMILMIVNASKNKVLKRPAAVLDLHLVMG